MEREDVLVSVTSSLNMFCWYFGGQYLHTCCWCVDYGVDNIALCSVVVVVFVVRGNVNDDGGN